MTQRAAKARRTIFAAAMASGLGTMAPDASAANRFWKNGVSIGNFSTSNNWSAVSAAGADNGGAPGAPDGTDTANILHSDAISRMITLDVSVVLDQLHLGNTGLGTDTLVQNGAFDLTSTNLGSGEFLGSTAGSKAVHSQSAGTNTNTTLRVGSATGSNATYNLSDGTIRLIAGIFSTLSVGFGGTGNFNQTGGNVLVGSIANTGVLAVGDSSGAVGNYNLSNAASSLTVRGFEYVGNNGAGTFTQTGGTHTVGIPEQPKAVYLGFGAASGSGTFILSGAQSVFTVNGGVYVGGGDDLFGPGGRGVLNVNGGTMSVSDKLRVWNTSGSIINFTGGTLNVGTLDTSGAPAKFNWNGGTLSVNGAAGLTIGSGGPLGTTVDLTAARTLNVTNALAIPHGGTLNVQAGTVTAGSINLGGALTGSGTVMSAVTTLNFSLISPGNAGPGVLTIAGLSLFSGGQIVYEPGDRIDVSFPNALNLGGTTKVVLTGAPSTGPMFTYNGALGGSPNILKFSGGAVGTEYSARNNATNHSVDLVAKRIATQVVAAVPGQPVPSTAGGGTLSSITALIPGGPAGNAAFMATIAGGTGGASGLFLGDGGPVVPIAILNQPAPGGGTFRFVGNAVASPGGVAFRGLMDGSGSTEGLFRGDGTNLVCIARQGQPAPGGGNFGIAFTNARINAVGQVAFTSITDTSGVFRGNGSSLIPIAKAGGTAPGGGFFATGGFSGVAINDSGQVAFFADIAGSSSTEGLFRSDSAGTALNVILRKGDMAPGGGTFSNFQVLALSTAGQLVFSSDTGLPSSPKGLFRGAGGSITLIARPGDPAANFGGGGTNGTFLDVSSKVTTSATGQVGFLALLGGTSDSTALGIFRGEGGLATAIVRQKQNAPGMGSGTFLDFTDAGTSPTGQVAFAATLAGTNGGTSDDAGIFLGDGQEVIALAREGQTINGSLFTIPLSATPASVNEFGQVPYNVTLASGAVAPHVFTPVLHFRNASSGNWDTSNNWTVGLPPAAVHEVVIDPLTSLTVTGPATSKTVKSLAIGGGGVPATLQLNTAGAVLKTSTLTIDTADAGKIDLATNGKLIITATPVATIAGYVSSGFHGGDWLGAGLTSSQAAANAGSAHKTAVGYATASSIGVTTFGGQSVVGTDALVRYTYSGDANLDGFVNGLDFNALATNFGGAGKFWFQGDYDFNGVVATTDFNLLAANFNSVLAAPALGALVPEPALGALVALPMLALRRRGRLA